MSLLPPTRRTGPLAGKFLSSLMLAFALLAMLPAPSSAFPADIWASADASQRRVLSEQNGSVNIRNGAHVRVHLDQGDVRVRTTGDGAVTYRLRIEVAAGTQLTSAPHYLLSGRNIADGATVIGHVLDNRTSGHYWVTLELEVPRATPLDVVTQGGAIEVQDIDGRLTCSTAGGVIRIGKVNNAARLETAGGDIVVQDVSGDLFATTGGGHILAGSVHGNATLNSAGGHIRVASVEGLARIDTGGGNIFLDRAGGRLIATTGGGRIMVGEVAGELVARTGGGGIRVWQLAGPAHLESAAGSIFLAGVTSPVSATTASGGITARFARPGTAPVVAPGRPETPRATLGELQCNGGDLIVFVPVDLGLTLDASIEGGENFHIVVDPALALQLHSNNVVTGRSLRAEGPMAGGGPLLRLRANAGNILLRPVSASEGDAQPGMPPEPAAAAVPPVPPAAPATPPAEAAAANLDRAITQMQRQLEVRQDELESFAAAQELWAMKLARKAQRDASRADGRTPNAEGGETADVDYDWSPGQLSQMDDLREKVAAWFTDRVVVSADQLRPRLIHRVDPVYPDSARQSGAEGPVRLRVAITRDGAVEDATVLLGNPELAAVAVAAVRRWRYRPTLLNGKPVPVLTVLTIVFHRPQ